MKSSKRTIQYICLILAWLVLWPVALLFLTSDQRDRILSDALAEMSFRSASFAGINAVLYVFLLNKCFRNLFYHRVGAISYLVSWIWRGNTTFSLLCNHIGGGFFAFHPYATIINAKSVGVNFRCRQCTTIGNKQDDKPNAIPTIGDNVTLGANVVIIGDISIGNNVIVGAGSVVVKDVPDNALVVGNPASVIKYIDSHCCPE